MRRSIFGAILFVMVSLVAFGQTASPGDAAQDRAQDHKELQELNRNAHQDKQAAQNELNDVKQDKTQLNKAVKNGDKAEAKKDSQNLHQAKNDLSKDKAEIQRDMQKSRQIRMNSGMAPRGGGRR